MGGFGGLLERTTSGVWHHEDRDTPLWLPLPTCTTNNTLPPNNHADLSPSTHRSHRRVHVGRRALRAAVCGVWRSFAHTNTQLPRAATLDKYAASAISVRVGGGGCLWMWLCGRWRRCAEARRRRDAAVRQESRISRMTKISELGCQQTPFKQPGAILGS